VHLHEASHTHYDLRLQMGGTLKSFAVPRGPSLNTQDKRLAVMTEDHPLEYVAFEAVIPEGNYGAGPMIVWDVGRVRYLESTAEDGILRRKIDFVLEGFKLRGRFALVETGSRKGGRSAGKEWLLIKKQDAHVTDRNLLETEPRSVLSGMTVDELLRAKELAAEIEARARDLGALERGLDASKLVPMRPSHDEVKLDDAERLYELAVEGVRVVADKHASAVALRYDNGRSATATYPEIARAVNALAPSRLVLDGAVVAFDEEGRPSFEKLGPRVRAERPLDVLRVQSEVSVSYLVFDVLALGPFDLTGLALYERKELLARIVQGRGLLRVLDHLEGGGDALLEFCRAQRLEGIVAKLRSSRYTPGPRRSADWIKVKSEREDDFVVLGYVAGRGKDAKPAELLLASFRGVELVYRGRVRDGVSDASDELEGAFEARGAKAYPGTGDEPGGAKGVRWLKPELVARVRYRGFDEESELSSAVCLGQRAEVGVEACRVAPPRELLTRDLPVEDPAPAAAPAPAAPPKAALRAKVNVTNRDKVFWPDEGYTKGDLIEYYRAVSPAMLPFLEDRPVVMVRYPDGIRGKSFFQWNVPQGTPDWLRRGALARDTDDEDDRREKTVFLLDDVDALVYLANLGTIPLHVLACREESRSDCDFLTIDFDIGEHPFERAVVLALTLRELLETIGLAGYPKTSGQKGLHVLVPLGPEIGFDTAKLLCELLGRLVVERHPALCTMERRVDQRGGKALVDVGQTGPSRTIVAPYSVRAWPGATVSTPLYWEEVHVALDPKRFTLLTVPARLAESGDPLAGLLEERPDVPGAVKELGQLFGKRA
jgi:bifunctional non-homologous end joining protein LigD